MAKTLFNATQLWRQFCDADTLTELLNVIENVNAAELSGDEYSSLAWALDEKHGELLKEAGI